MEIWELVAREEIRDLVAAYAYYADSGRFADLAELFATDGVLETPDGQAHSGRDAIRAFLGRTKQQLAEAATTAPPLIRHHVSNLRIEVNNHNEATGSAYFFVVTQHGPDHWGRYRDHYVRVAGEWRFAHRCVRLDGRRDGAGR